MKNRIATIAAALAAPVLAAAILAGPASARPAVSAAQTVTSTFCNAPAGPVLLYQACVTVKAAGGYVYWVRGTVHVQPGKGGFTGFATLTLAGFYASTGTFSVANGGHVVKTMTFTLNRNMPGGDRVCTTVRTKAGTVRAQWCGPMSDFGQNPRR